MTTHPHTCDTTPHRIMRKPETIRTAGLSGTTIWRKVKKAEFPAPVRLGGNSVGWIADEVYAWVASRPRTGEGAGQ